MNVSSPPPVLVLEAGRTEQQYWRDLWRYRELAFFLSWRDILVRYKQTVIGIAWSLIRPLLTMVVFTFVFGKLAKMDAHGAPYPLMVFAALVPWQFFANALAECSTSVVDNANLIAKVYFPRLLVPVSAVFVTVVDFAISAVFLVLLMAYYQVVPGPRLMLLPLFILLALGTAMGAGLWLAALNVRYRDFRYIVPFIIQFGLYVSPVGFSSAVVPEAWRWAFALNPMVGVIDGFRWSLLGGAQPLFVPGLLLSAVLSLVLLGTGVAYFRRTERTFADVI